MRESKRRIGNIMIVFALIICPALVAIAAIANAQSEAGVRSNPTLGPTPSPAPKGTAQSPLPTSPTPATTTGRVSSDKSILAFAEDFSSPTAFSERFDHGWSGEWNAGSMFHEEKNDWHGDHGMMCENPNTSNRTIHLTSQMQANDAAFYYCMPDGDPAKGHLMTSVNTDGYVTAWFSPKQTFHNVSKVCWDQNVTDLGGWQVDDRQLSHRCRV